MRRIAPGPAPHPRYGSAVPPPQLNPAAADLLDRLDVAIVDGDFKTDVALRREPTESELERLNDVFQTAQAEFCRRLSEPLRRLTARLPLQYQAMGARGQASTSP